MVRVSEVRKPDRCVPPSTVLMLLAKLKNRFRVSVVILQADFDVHVILCRLPCRWACRAERTCRDEVLMNSTMPPVYLKLGPLGFAGLGVGLALVGERDGPRPLFRNASSRRRCEKRIEVVFGGGENRLVGMKWTRVPRFLLAPAFLSFTGGLALGVSLLPGETVAPDFQIEFFTERVHAAHADAVQASRNFVGVAVELAAGVQRWS